MRNSELHLGEQITRSYRVNLPRCYFDKSSSSSSPTANNAQGSAENGAIGIGGNNQNTKVNVSIQNLDANVAQSAIDAITQANSDTLAANSQATTNALTVASEATHGITDLSAHAIDAVSAANQAAQNFVNSNTALAFDTIDHLVTGQTAGLVYEANQATTAAAAAGAANSPVSPTVIYAGPSDASPATISAQAETSADHTATYLTIAVAALTLYYFFKTGKL